MKHYLKSILFVLCFATTSVAQQTYIVTVGVDTEALEAGKRDTFAPDAEGLMALFVKRSALPVADAVSLEGPKATQKNFLEKLASIKASATEKDVVLLFFTVHGKTNKKGKFKVELADDSLQGSRLAQEFDGMKARVVLLLDTCGSGGMLNHTSKNPNVCIMASCHATEDSSWGKRRPLYGYYANAIYSVVSEAGQEGLTLGELDSYLLDPRNVRKSKNQHAVSFVPKEMKSLQLFK